MIELLILLLAIFPQKTARTRDAIHIIGPLLIPRLLGLLGLLLPDITHVLILIVTQWIAPALRISAGKTAFTPYISDSTTLFYAFPSSSAGFLYKKERRIKIVFSRIYPYAV